MSDSGRSFRRRLCLAVDIQGYSGYDGVRQDAAQELLGCALDDAAQRCGLDRARWWRQDAGDGELAVIDDDGCEPVVVGKFPAALSETLHHARGVGGPRVRLAVHHGVTWPARKGYAGDGVVDVSRIVGADVVKRALDAAPGANLVTAISEQTFLDVVRSGLTDVRAADFWVVRVENKSYRGAVRLHIPGAAPTRPAPEPEHEPPSDTAPPGTVHQTAHGGMVVQIGGDGTIASLNQIDGDLYAPVHLPPRRRRG